MVTSEREFQMAGQFILFDNGLINNYIANFENLFTKSQLMHMSRLIEGIILHGSGNINELANFCIDNVDQSSINRFLND